VDTEMTVVVIEDIIQNQIIKNLTQTLNKNSL
jgi:hypothetical protein